MEYKFKCCNTCTHKELFSYPPFYVHPRKAIYVCDACGGTDNGLGMASRYCPSTHIYAGFGPTTVYADELGSGVVVGSESAIKDLAFRSALSAIVRAKGNTPTKLGRFPYGFSDSIENVISNDPATIVFWNDGTKTVVKVNEGEPFDPEKGLAMAISKKVLGNNGKYYDTFKRWLPEITDKTTLYADGTAVTTVNLKEKTK